MQVYLTQCHHQRVRMECVSYIRAHQEDFQNVSCHTHPQTPTHTQFAILLLYVYMVAKNIIVTQFFTEPFEVYLGRLARELWGGEVELVALSNLYTRTIVLYMCDEQNDSLHHRIVFPNDAERVPLKELVNPVSYYRETSSCQC